MFASFSRRAGQRLLGLKPWGDPSGPLLSRRAIERGDLRELQRVCDAGSDDAGAQLDRLLRGDTPPVP